MLYRLIVRHGWVYADYAGSKRSENNESSTDSDSNAKAFLDQNDFWQIEDKEGEQEVLLRRQYDDEHIVCNYWKSCAM